MPQRLTLGKTVQILTAFLLLATCVGAGRNLFEWPGRNFRNPERPNGVAVFMANGIFDPSDDSYVAPTGEDFDRTILCRDDEAIALRKQESIDYFLERFGVDFNESDFALGGAAVLFQTYQDPRWNYRCYKLPDRIVPRSGLIVHDCQWVMFLAADVTLFGSWGGSDGEFVPAGSVAVDGEYVIQGTNQYRFNHPRNIYIRFNSVIPIENAASGNIKFDCQLSSDDYGLGAALGRQESYDLPDGSTQISINNVLQFPAPLWTMNEAL
ncbi:MAG: hypothetical protein AAF802_20925 [Planctomycetota bacterium]